MATTRVLQCLVKLRKLTRHPKKLYPSLQPSPCVRKVNSLERLGVGCTTLLNGHEVRDVGQHRLQISHLPATVTSVYY